MHELLDQLDLIATRDSWVGESARQARIFLNLKAAGQITLESARHNIATIQKTRPHNILVQEFEEKLDLDTLLTQISEALSDA